MIKSNILYYGGTFMDYYDAYHATNDCRQPAATDIFLRFSAAEAKQCIQYPVIRMDDGFDKHSTETVQNVVRSFISLLPTATGMMLARILMHKMPPQDLRRILVEFLVLMLPNIVTLTVGNRYLNHYVGVVTVLIIVYSWYTFNLQQSKKRTYEMGTKPLVMTLIRASAYIITAIDILAVDFNSFPRKYRKSRRFGASIMDTGIGIFVMTMGMVSRRPTLQGFRHRLIKSTGPLLFLGAARTIVISAINYGQDDHEYGVHMNAFFTLGLTKLFGTFASAIARSDEQLLPLALVVLTLHELALQLGISDYVMDEHVERNTLLSANREGLCSLPGFVAMYLLCIAFGNWLRTKEMLSYREIKRKLQQMFAISALGWPLVVLSAYTVGIARVTCNAGYVIWVFILIQTMMSILMLMFDLILKTKQNLQSSSSQIEAAVGDINQPSSIGKQTVGSTTDAIPTLMEALNWNGLTFFLLTNVLTGLVNIFLKPEDRNDLETVVILMAYMFLGTGSIYLLYRKGIRIA